MDFLKDSSKTTEHLLIFHMQECFLLFTVGSFNFERFLTLSLTINGEFRHQHTRKESLHDDPKCVQTLLAHHSLSSH